MLACYLARIDIRVRLSSFVTPQTTTKVKKYRNINLLYIGITKLGNSLDPTNPTPMNVAWETLDIRCPPFSGGFRYLCRHSHFLSLHPRLTAGLHCYKNAPLPPRLTAGSTISVTGLSPDHLRRKILIPVSCYAIFKRWLLLSQLPGCV